MREPKPMHTRKDCPAHRNWRAETLIIFFLGLFAMTALVLAAVIIMLRPEAKSELVVALLVTPMAGAIGSLGTLLTKIGASDTQDVRVQNTPSNPVPTEPVEP